jgi:DNA/RNA-binding domain of Phe-tRNA-synthetase-like protein
LPISLVDLDSVKGPLRVAIADQGSSYVFNPSGQTIDIGGLLCLFDTDGPCANAVKDSQRTKTSGTTTRTLSIIWGTLALPGRSEQVQTWYQKLLSSCGEPIDLSVIVA